MFIRDAAKFLENPGFFIKATHALESPLEKGLAILPQPFLKSLSESTEKALHSALHTALLSLGERDPDRRSFKDILYNYHPNYRFYNWSSAVTGAMSGFIGLPAFIFELPVTTTLMLRSIAKTARDLGCDL